MEADVTLRVLLVEPDDERFEALRRAVEALTSLRVRVERARSPQDAYDALRAGRVDVCLAPSKEGPDVSAALTLRLARADTFVPVIAVVEDGAAGVEAIRFEGAADYLIRDQLAPEVVERALWVAQARREAVEAFRHEQEVFAAALRDGDVAVVELDRGGQVVRLSAPAAAAVGRDVRDVLGRSYAVCFEEDLHAAIAGLLDGAGARPLRFRQHPGGRDRETRPVDWVLSPLLTGGAVGVGRLGGALPEAEAHGLLRHVADAIPMVVFATAADGRLTYLDGSALDTFGLEGGEAVGTSVFDLYDAAAERAGYVRRALAGEPSDVLLDVRGRSFRARYLPLLGDDGGVAGMVLVAYDATEEVGAARRFRQLACALDAVPDAIGMSDVSGAAVYLNRTMVERFGYTLDELNEAGGPPALYRDAAVVTEVFDAIRTGERWEGEAAFVTRAGEAVRVHLRADAVYGDEGELIGLVGVHRLLD